MSELYLVRHAQASFGAANYDQLSDLGHKQSRWLGDYMGMRGLKFDTLVVGDMVRHHETMNGICAGMDIDGSSRLVLPGRCSLLRILFRLVIDVDSFCLSCSLGRSFMWSKTGPTTHFFSAT